jgi:hypothetical protein
VLTAHEVYLPKSKLAVEGQAACRRPSISAARRTRPPVGCSPSRSPMTSTERSTHDAQPSPQNCSQFGGCSVMIDLAQRSEPYEIALPYGLGDGATAEHVRHGRGAGRSPPFGGGDRASGP